jgi:type IV pilus assembly protein PilC
LSRVSLGLAHNAEQGIALSDSLARGARLPGEFLPMIRWGEDRGELPEAFATIREMYVRRVHRRAVMLQSVLPPILFVVLGSMVGFVVVALFIPLVSLIQGLTG